MNFHSGLRPSMRCLTDLVFHHEYCVISVVGVYYGRWALSGETGVSSHGWVAIRLWSEFQQGTYIPQELRLCLASILRKHVPSLDVTIIDAGFFGRSFGGGCPPRSLRGRWFARGGMTRPIDCHESAVISFGCLLTSGCAFRLRMGRGTLLASAFTFRLRL